MRRVLAWATNLFPLWVVAGCVWAWLQPQPWAAFRPFIEPGLGVIMLGMGLTLRVADFAAVARQPRLVLLGVAAQFLIMPLTCGVAVNTALGRMRDPEKIRRWVDAVGPLMSSLMVVMIVGSIVAAKKAEIAAAAVPLFASVFVLHSCGFALGYGFATLLGGNEGLRRTVSIEVGMQNSGLGAALATRHFPQLALAPVPAAISAVFHCLIGSLLAAGWSRRGGKPGDILRRARTQDQAPPDFASWRSASSQSLWESPGRPCSTRRR